MKWPEWLVMAITFLILAIFCFLIKSLGGSFGFSAEVQKYLSIGIFFGIIFAMLFLASIINLIITATRHHVEKLRKK